MTRFFYSCERVRLIVRVEIHAELEFVLFFDRENASARKGSGRSEREIRRDEIVVIVYVEPHAIEFADNATDPGDRAGEIIVFSSLSV
jgi:hypothetical protein